MIHDCHFNDFISADVSVASAKAGGAASAKADGATSAKADGATSAKADGATSAMRHRRRHRRQSLAKKGERERD